MDKEALSRSCVELVRRILTLVDKGESITADHFIRLTEQENFIEFLLENYGGGNRLYYLSRASSLFKPETLEFANDALHRHANVVTMEDYGLRQNGFLFAANVVLSVLEEVHR